MELTTDHTLSYNALREEGTVFDGCSRFPTIFDRIETLEETKRMKKILALSLALVLALSLAACGGKDSSQPSGGDAQPSGGSDSQQGADSLPGEGMRIALVCDKIGVNPFLTEMVRALDETAAEYGFTQVVVECADNAAYEDNIRALVAEGCDLIIGGGWAAGDPLDKVSREFPEACSYALIDSEIDNELVKCISYREQEGAFLIGKLAAYTVDGESHVYGGVHCNEGPGSWKYRYGYMEGVKSIDPEATFVFNYTNSYSDPAKAKELAIQQFEQGCKFINGAAAAGDSGVYEAAMEKGFYTSGQDVDETSADNPYIVSSQLKDTYQTVKNLVDGFFGGSWTPDNTAWGVSEGTIGAVNVTHDSPNPRSDRLTDEEIADIQAVVEQMKSGALDMTDVPAEEDYSF